MISPQALFLIASGAIEDEKHEVAQSKDWSLSRTIVATGNAGGLAQPSWTFTSRSPSADSIGGFSVEITGVTHPEAQMKSCMQFYVLAIRGKATSIVLSTGAESEYFISVGRERDGRTEISFRRASDQKICTRATLDRDIGVAFAADLLLVSKFSKTIPRGARGARGED